MSFLKDVLSTADEVMTIDICATKPQIEEKIMRLKDDIKDHMDKIFINFIPSAIDHSEILKVVEEIETDILRIIDSANDVNTEISNSTSEIQILMKDLRETTFSLEMSNKLCKIDKCFTDIDAAHANVDFIRMATALKQIDGLLEHSNDIEYLNIFEGIKMRKEEEDMLFHAETNSAWDDYMQLSESTLNDVKTVTVIVSVIALDQLHALITAYTIYGDISYILRLSQFFMKHVLTPIITQRTVIARSVDNNHSTLTLHTDLKSKARMNYDVVFENILTAFDGVGSVNVCINDEECVFSKIGTIIKKEFCELLIKECLVHTIPTSAEELQDTTVATKIEELQEKLTEMYFFDENDIDILTYAKNFDILFANKICQTVLHDARYIIKKDIHNMIDVGEGVIENLDVTEMKTGVPVCSPMVFPRCMVSTNVLELQNHIQNAVLAKAGESSDMCRARLLCTAVNIVKLYQIIVPVHHERILLEIPQQSALFHNNCLFMAHWLLTTSFQMKSRKILNYENIPAMFVDEVHMLRSLGCKHFLIQMQRQKKIMLDILRDSDISSISQVSELKTTGQAVLQCLRQLELLRSVWDNVLPSNVYCKSIGCLLNALIEELIQRVCNIEDIPANIAVQLVGIFHTVTNTSITIFNKSGAVFQYVKYWQKLKELSLVLEANLIEIRDRWSDGKGPLADVFKSEEIKRLIRALFQNTDRRADVLMRIK